MKYNHMIRRMAVTVLAAGILLGLLSGCVGEDDMGLTSDDLRKVYKLEICPSAGIDVTDSPLLIDARRACDLRNLYREGSALSKRTGWMQIAQVWTPDEEGERQTATIRGLWSFRDGDGNCLIIHAGERLYEADPDAGSWHEILLPDGAAITDTPSEGFLVGGRLYLVGAGGYLAYGNFGSGREVRRVTDLPDVYVPTTTTDIIDEYAEGQSYRASLDAVNMLTATRKNTLIGRKLTENEEDGLSFLLDATPDDLSDLTVEIETVDDDGKPVSYRLITGWQCYSLGIGELVYRNSRYLVPEGWTAADGLGTYTDASGQTQTGSLGTIDYDTGRLYLQGSCFDRGGKPVASFAPEVADVDNITVTFRKTPDVNTVRDAETATFGTLFGEDGHADRLFLSGIPGKPNRFIFSDPGDPTYFPDINFFDIGSDAAAIVAFSRVSDGVLAVHKAASLQEPTIYYLTGSGHNDTENLRYSVSFSAVAGGRGSPVLSRRACTDLFGDPLILTRDGVYAIRLQENVTTEARRLEERSRSVRMLLRALSDAELAETVAVVWRDWYLLSLPDGRILLADSTDTYTDGTLSAGNAQYEWYIWDSVPATAFALWGDRLIFGGADGRVYLFSDARDQLGTGSLYADRTVTVFDAEDMVLDPDTGLLEYGTALRKAKIKVGDHICFNERAGLYHRLLSPGEYTLCGEGRIRLINTEAIVNWHEGMTVRLDVTYGMEFTGIYTVTDIDRGDGSFALATAFGAPVALTISDVRFLMPVTDRELCVARVDDDQQTLALTEFAGDSDPLQLTYLYDFIKGDYFIAEGELCGSLIQDAPVVAEWKSRVFDLSSDCYAKTLRRMVVTAEPGQSGRVTVVYDVREGRDRFATPGTGGISPSAFHLAEFSFHNFAVSYTREICRRNVNFLQVSFRSEDAEPCRILRITVFYTVTGFRRGGM